MSCSPFPPECSERSTAWNWLLSACNASDLDKGPRETSAGKEGCKEYPWDALAWAPRPRELDLALLDALGLGPKLVRSVLFSTLGAKAGNPASVVWDPWLASRRLQEDRGTGRSQEVG